MSQLAAAVAVSPHWLYAWIHNGRNPIGRDTTRKLYLFPDTEATRQMIQDVKDAEFQEPRFGRYCHAHSPLLWHSQAKGLWDRNEHLLFTVDRRLTEA